MLEEYFVCEYQYVAYSHKHVNICDWAMLLHMVWMFVNKVEGLGIDFTLLGMREKPWT